MKNPEGQGKKIPIENIGAVARNISAAANVVLLLVANTRRSTTTTY
jgi:hypothetical protein